MEQAAPAEIQGTAPRAGRKTEIPAAEVRGTDIAENYRQNCGQPFPVREKGKQYMECFPCVAAGIGSFCQRDFRKVPGRCAPFRT